MIPLQRGRERRKFKDLIQFMNLIEEAQCVCKIKKKASMLLPVQLRLQILRMEYLRWVERDDIIIFLLNTGSAGVKVTFTLKKQLCK